MGTHRNRTGGPLPLASGQILAPGEDGDPDLKTDHDKALVDDGLLLKLDAKAKKDKES
jgi:hypothetical protein